MVVFKLKNKFHYSKYSVAIIIVDIDKILISQKVSI